jgi:anti-anti-sigma factor
MSGRDDAVVVEHAGRVRVVRLRGEHDVDTKLQLESVFAEAVASGDPLVADLTACTFIDSNCVAVLFGAGQSVPVGRFAVVITPNSDAARLLNMVAFSAVLPVYDKQAEALAAMTDGDA